MHSMSGPRSSDDRRNRHAIPTDCFGPVPTRGERLYWSSGTSLHKLRVFECPRPAMTFQREFDFTPSPAAPGSTAPDGGAPTPSFVLDGFWTRLPFPSRRHDVCRLTGSGRLQGDRIGRCGRAWTRRAQTRGPAPRKAPTMTFRSPRRVSSTTGARAALGPREHGFGGDRRRGGEAEHLREEAFPYGRYRHDARHSQLRRLWEAGHGVFGAEAPKRLHRPRARRELGLINMKGRLYDPKLRRFTAPDPFVTEPFNPQGMNRYSYVQNSPLTYTDPSGFSIPPTGIGFPPVRWANGRRREPVAGKPRCPRTVTVAAIGFEYQRDTVEHLERGHELVHAVTVASTGPDATASAGQGGGRVAPGATAWGEPGGGGRGSGTEHMGVDRARSRQADPVEWILRLQSRGCQPCRWRARLRIRELRRRALAARNYQSGWQGTAGSAAPPAHWHLDYLAAGEHPEYQGTRGEAMHTR